MLLKTFSNLLVFVATVAAHGYVDNVTIGGVLYTPTMPYPFTNPSRKPYTDPYYSTPPPRIIRPVQGNGPITDLTLIDLQCGGYTAGGIVGSSPAALTAGPVAAGSTVSLRWTLWPDSHSGPVITYMAKCPSAGCSNYLPGTALKQIFSFVAFRHFQGGNSVTMAPTVIADPDGDIVLLLDPEERDGPGSPSYNRHVLCSSKHLTVASSIFKAMLKNTFSEGTTLMTIGQVKIPLPEDDPTIMTSLVLLIHNRHNHPEIRPPRDLNFLNKAAILVDKYQLHEAVNYFAAAWTRFYLDRNPIRLHPFRDFPLLFCVTWVFELEAPFKEITRFIQYNCVGSIKDLMKIGGENLPIPAGVIETLEAARLSAIEDIIQVLANLITKYQQRRGAAMFRLDGTQLANFNVIHVRRDMCDATVLGSLTRGAIQEGLYPPAATGDLRNGSVYLVMQRVLGVNFTTGCENLRDLMPNSPGCPRRVHSCHGIREQMGASMMEVKGSLSGLCLKDEKERFKASLFLGDR
ncbi:hypothetical protein DID88_000132 [Monilinia fructigena]|uniref:lytic cellulose monooxygenase (C4-dehydrogenating) n=1 Tax=Monilinia fructigena TaxID=38457 RepID=A0A395IJG9_9HELO|nr:hypothetical protein DID88_000132 [Monilinia fructigena]